MSGDDDMADIDGVDPTPIHHPVDDEAIASAVHDATGDVDDGTMEADHQVTQQDDHAHDSSHRHHHRENNAHEDQTQTYQHGSTEEEKSQGNDNDNDKGDEGKSSQQQESSSSLLPDLSTTYPKKIPKKRARRVGRVEVSRKAPKLSESAALQEVAVETQAVAERPPTAVPQPPVAVVVGGEVNGGEEATTIATMPTVDASVRVLSKHDEKWNSMFQELLNFKAKYNHLNVPQCYKENHRLGRWVHYQRVEYWVYQDTGGGKITPDRISRLEAIGFEWDPQKAQWNNMFKKLEQFKDEMGHCKVPKGYTADTELANWVRNQRLEQANRLKGKKSRMTDERFKKLDELGFKWSGAPGKNRNSNASKPETTTATTTTTVQTNSDDKAHSTDAGYKEATTTETKTAPPAAKMEETTTPTNNNDTGEKVAVTKDVNVVDHPKTVLSNLPETQESVEV